MNERDRQTPEETLEFAERAIRITGGRDYESFLAEEALLYAVRYCVQAIGGLAAGLSAEARDRTSVVPWRQIVAMRHRLAHDFRTIADLAVFNTVVEDLPFLVRSLRGSLHEGRGSC